jgi:hypothetical protein
MVSTLSYTKGLLPLDYVDRLVNYILHGSDQGGTGTTPEEIQTRLYYTMKFPTDDVNREYIRIIVKKLRDRGLFISEEDVNEYKSWVRNGGRKVRKRKTNRKRRINK